MRYNGEEIRVFPNPVSEGNLNVSLNRFKGQDITIQLINSLGRVVKTVQLDQADQDLINLDLSEYIDGYYKLFVIPQNNKAVEETVIIQRF
ncbi:MAG: T9SS type A sorting domain-containing protein [Saprospiraceae bacterium]